MPYCGINKGVLLVKRTRMKYAEHRPYIIKANGFYGLVEGLNVIQARDELVFAVGRLRLFGHPSPGRCASAAP